MRAAGSMTADQLFTLNLPDKQTELVGGVLCVREPPGGLHGSIAMNIAFEIKRFVDAHKLGYVFAAETGFKLFTNPDTVRAPDAAFVRRDRLPGAIPVKYVPLAPDLAVEVLSPDDRPGKMREKVADWLRAGSELVWVIDPMRRTAHVYRSDGTDTALGPDAALSGEHVLPGFACVLNVVVP